MSIRWNTEIFLSQHILASSFTLQPIEQHLSASDIRTCLSSRECFSKPEFFNSELLFSSFWFCLLRIFLWNSSKLRFVSLNAGFCNSGSDSCFSDTVSFVFCGQWGMNSNIVFKVSASSVMEDGMISRFTKGGRQKYLC